MSNLIKLAIILHQDQIKKGMNRSEDQIYMRCCNLDTLESYCPFSRIDCFQHSNHIRKYGKSNYDTCYFGYKAIFDSFDDFLAGKL